MLANPPSDCVIRESSEDCEESESNQCKVVVDGETFDHENADVAPRSNRYPGKGEEECDYGFELRPPILLLHVWASNGWTSRRQVNVAAKKDWNTEIRAMDG